MEPIRSHVLLSPRHTDHVPGLLVRRAFIIRETTQTKKFEVVLPQDRLELFTKIITDEVVFLPSLDSAVPGNALELKIDPADLSRKVQDGSSFAVYVDRSMHNADIALGRPDSEHSRAVPNVENEQAA